MSVSTIDSLPRVGAPSSLWRETLEREFEIVRRECKAAMASDHPGAMRRTTDLLRLALNIRAQLDEIGEGR